MRRFVVICCIGFVLLSTLDFICLPNWHTAGTRSYLAQAETDHTELMKQSDYRQRTRKEREDRAEEKQVAALGAPDSTSGESDYLVLIILAGSAVVLVLVAGQRAKRRMKMGR